VRVHLFLMAALMMASAAIEARAQPIDFSGKWSLSGQVIAGRNFTSFAQICGVKQTGDQLVGPAGARMEAARPSAWSVAPMST